MDGTDNEPNTTRENGFTLIELMTVVLIIAILIAIAIPIFLGARTRASDRHAESIVRDALVAGHIAFSDGQTFSGITPGALKAAETELSFVGGSATATAGSQQISVGSGTNGADGYLVLASRSASGTCFAAVVTDSTGARFREATGSTCAADDFDPTAGGWQDAWS
jgi:type IV pilus assembly protein PilA